MRYLPFFALLIAAPASAVPPPPPPPAALNAAQTFIAALTSKDLAAYGDALADDFSGYESESQTPQDRAAWLGKMRDAFANDSFHVTIMKVFQGSATVAGRHRQRIMVVERISNFPLRDGVPGDCCAWYLTETLTMDGGKVARIDRSTLYATELSATGKRTDIP
ncbi:nuclear transport factor 2 family protein [Sphingobium yanoikuyae]|uniref:nuclear transport factor 2 family protein n=1 Tax=Sphingobium yanoikuyae TaxID=13690 RepID=UPI0028DAFDE6|nr:nuclear transport factor 2 family protein [Sphingobium yanoikuyae]